MVFTCLPMLVLHSVHAVLVDPAPDSCHVHLAVWEAVVEFDVTVFVLQLVRYVGVDRNEDDEFLGATALEAALVRGTK